MKVKFLEPLSTVSGSYGVGEIVDLDDRRANNYVNAGWAEFAEPERNTEKIETAESKVVTEKAVKIEKKTNPNKGIKPLKSSDGKKTATSKADEIGLKADD